MALVATPLQARDGRGRVEYIGGTVDSMRQGTAALIKTTDRDYLALVTRTSTMKILYQRVNLLEYGQNVSRRYLLALTLSPMFVLAKKRKHFLTLGFSDDDSRQQAMVFIVDKNDVRLLLASLEARTGQRVEFQDAEARKAGKG